VRLALVLVLWLMTTVALAVALPTSWAQKNLIDESGYAAFAASAAGDPKLQQAMSNELTTEVSQLLYQNGYEAAPGLVKRYMDAYTASPAFPGQFAQVNDNLHHFAFTDSPESGSKAPVVDLSPMLNDQSFKTAMTAFGIEMSGNVTVPLTQADGAQPGQLRQLTTWGPRLSVGAAVLTAVFALLTVVAARFRDRALGTLGASALLVGAAGWAAIDVGRPHVDDALTNIPSDIRQIADVMVGKAEGNLHLWLSLTLVAGGVLAILGMLVAVLSGRRKRRQVSGRDVVDVTDEHFVPDSERQRA
jgi:hypothetical protein